jgi:hypothetical protein
MSEKKQKKAIVIGCFVVTFIMVCLSSSWVYWQISRNRQDPGYIADQFVTSLMTNDLETARSLVISSKHAEIEKWVSTHQPFDCDNFAYETGATGSGVSLGGNTWNFSVIFLCYDPLEPYCISVTDIYVTRTDDTWQVTDWKFVCEVNNFCDVCN